MFGISFGEMMLLVIVGIIVVGPRELPSMMRSLGRNITKLRRTATELRAQSGIDEILQNEGIHREVQDLQKLATGRIFELGLHDPILPAVEASGASSSSSSDLYSSRRNPPRNREYPAGSPDSYDAPSDETALYQPEAPEAAAEAAPTAAATTAAAPPAPAPEPPATAGAIARGSLPPDTEAALHSRRRR